MFKDILAISGQPGLFKKVSQGNNSIIVESLLTGKRSPAYSSSKIIALDDIAIFTSEEEVPLRDILKKIIEKEDGGKTIDHKSSGKVLQEYFAEILPDYDRDRVYTSDIKKVIQWYNILQLKEMLIFEEEEETQKEDKEATKE